MPRRARSIGVDLDTQPIGVREVQRLAHEVIRHADPDLLRGQVRGKAAEGRAVGQEQCEVIQAERAAPRPCDAGPAVQDNQGPIVTVCRQDGRVVCGLPGAQSDDALVILQRSLQIADLQMHCAMKIAPTTPRRKVSPTFN